MLFAIALLFFFAAYVVIASAINGMSIQEYIQSVLK